MQSTRVKLGPHFLRLALPLGLLLLAAGLFLGTYSLKAFSDSPYPLTPNPPFTGRAAMPTEATPRLVEARIPVEDKLLRGETVTEVFGKLGLHGAEAQSATNALAGAIDLRTLKAGSVWTAALNADASLAAFTLTLAGDGRVEMNRQGDGWAAAWKPFTRSVVVRALRGRLDGALETSIRQAGGPASLAWRMADVLQWDIDFNRDLQKGDGFEVLYQEILLEGKPHDVGQILAVSYDNAGRRLEAYRFGESDSFYDGDGRPLRKMFLRSPLRYSRVTSRFSNRRFHPVLKIYRPHYGVDYGTPTGTPVQVTANGVVVSTGWDRGGGNVVKVRHAGGFVTAYLHLSRFAKGIRPGARVRQGDTIAFSGATGLASGPHLDYRVQHNGRWIDPLSLKGVRDEPIATTALASFRSWRDTLRVSLARGVVPKDLTIPGEQPQRAILRGTPARRPGAVAR
ncbi:MAG TPA: hypothetical protein DD490_27920 [Acidobacteria bacterium]|nr:hypothetical protein [Acidobacteriota bacterium]